MPEKPVSHCLLDLAPPDIAVPSRPLLLYGIWLATVAAAIGVFGW